MEDQRSLRDVRVSRRIGAGLLALLLCAALESCGGPSRSVAAVCKVWDTEGLALHDKYVRAGEGAKRSTAGALGALISLIGAPSDLARLMRQMGQVAPSEVAPDFEAMADSLKKVSETEGDAITNPFGALAKNLVGSIAVAGSVERVNSFLGRNCGIPGSA